MRNSRERLARVVVACVWVGGLALAIRLAAPAPEPTEVLGLGIAVYLAAWGLAFFLSEKSTTAKTARFLACSVAILLMTALVEAPVALRWIDYRHLFATPTAAWRRPGFRADPDLIYVRDGYRPPRARFTGGDLTPLRGAKLWRLYDSSKARYDAKGFRNPRDLRSADVVVVGDSFVEGLQVEDRELMTSRLADLTGASVANLGRSGDGPQQERFILERNGLPLAPRACVWAFYEGNDLEDASEYEKNRKIIPRLRPPTAARSFYERSFLRNAILFAKRSLDASGSRVPAALHAGEFASSEFGPTPLYFASDDYHRSDSQADPSRWESLRGSLAAARELCTRNGVDLVVVFIPTKWRIYRDVCRFPQDSRIKEWKLNDLPERVRQLVASIDPKLAFVDLTPRFQAEAASGSLLYLPDDTHWTAEGHRSAALAIAPALGKLASRDREQHASR